MLGVGRQTVAGKRRSTGEIWLLLDSSGIGGIESHVLCLGSALLELGLPVRVLFLADHGHHPLHDALVDLGVPFRVIAGGWVGLVRAVAAAAPSLIHTHGYKAGIEGRIIARGFGVPCVSTFHAGEPGAGRVRLYSALDRLSARLAGGIVAVSERIARQLPARARVIDNFVSLADPPSGEARQVAFVGRLSHEKGPDLFCRLAGVLPELDLVLYGDGPLRAELEASNPRVRFAGQQASMNGLWAGIGLLCMTSRDEGLPMAALEAMAHGIPVAAFAVGALPTLIEPGRNGWLAPPLDLEAMEAAVMRWAALDRDARGVLSEGARESIAARFTPEAVLPRLLAIYQQAGWHGPECLSDGGSAPPGP